MCYWDSQELNLRIFDFKSNKAIVSFVVAVGVIVMSVYFVLSEMSSQSKRGFYYERYGAVLDAVRNPNNYKNISGVLIGASDVAMNFSGTNLAQKLGLPKSSILNLGCIMTGSDLSDNIAKELELNLKSVQKELDFAIFSFRPMMYTTNYRQTMVENLNGFNRFAAININYKKLYQNNLVSILDRWTAQKFFSAANQGFGADAYRELLNSDYFVPGTKIGYRNSYSDIWKNIAADFQNNPWDFSTSGDIDIFHNIFNKKYQNLIESHKQSIYAGGFESHVAMFNPIKMDLDASLIAKFESSVSSLASVADTVFIVYYPDILTESYPQISDIGKQRINKTLQKIASISKVKILNIEQRLKLIDGDYFDLVHLNESGKEKLNSILAEEISAVLSARIKSK